jgi:hypothetical protein
MTSAELIRAVGEALWGEHHWRAEMSRALGVRDRPLRRWAAGEVEPPSGIWRELLKAVDARRAQLEHVRDELARHPSLSNSERPSATASDET